MSTRWSVVLSLSFLLLASCGGGSSDNQQSPSDQSPDLNVGDTDNDGIADGEDADADGDGLNNDVDENPLDTDNDTIPNDLDADDDNDGVPDVDDAFPLDATESQDSDNDGIGDNADPDSSVVQPGETLPGTIKIGVLLGFTGPIEDLAPGMAAGAELAISEVNSSGAFLTGSQLDAVRADSTCVDAISAISAAEQLISLDQVAGIVGADCSNATLAIVNDVSTPAAVPMISPSATSPDLSTTLDDGYFFRIVPSDARQGEILAEALMDRAIDAVAISYVNSDYGNVLSEAFSAHFTALGGEISANLPYELDDENYSDNIDELAASGAQHLVIFGTAALGGGTMLRTAVNTGAFASYSGSDAMLDTSIIDELGSAIDGMIVVSTTAESASESTFEVIASANDVDGTGAFVAESYDAAALLSLAIQQAGSIDGTAIRDALPLVANAPGFQIDAGELMTGLSLIALGEAIDYQGATGVELNQLGDAIVGYTEYEIVNGEFLGVRAR